MKQTLLAHAVGRSKPKFNGGDGWAQLHRMQTRNNTGNQRRLVMAKTSAKIILALVAVLATPAASVARIAGAAGSGNAAISGISPGPANVGGLNNVTVDPSGIGNASKIPPLPSPQITAPQIPQFK